MGKIGVSGADHDTKLSCFQRQICPLTGMKTCHPRLDFGWLRAANRPGHNSHLLHFPVGGHVVRLPRCCSLIPWTHEDNTRVPDLVGTVTHDTQRERIRSGAGASVPPTSARTRLMLSTHSSNTAAAIRLSTSIAVSHLRHI